MDIFDLKTAGVTAPVPDTALLFGADSDTATQPSLYPRSRFAQLTAGGNLGIGTASPAVRIESYDVSNGAALELLRLSNAGTGANTKALLGFNAANTQYAQILGGYGASSPEMNFKLPTASAGKFTWQPSSGAGVTMTLDTTGLGIGTGSPDSKLHVVSAGSGTPLFVQGTLGASAYMDFGGNATTLNNGTFTIGQASDGVATIFQRANADMYFATNSTEQVRITAAGLVGIATSSPAARLDVYHGDNAWNIDASNPSGRLRISGSMGSGAYIESTDFTGATYQQLNLDASMFAFNVQGTNAIYVNGSRNVGIGTTSPSSKLEVAGAIAGTGLTLNAGSGVAALNLYTSTLTSGFSLGYLNGTADPAMYLWNRQNGPQIFGVNNTERLRIDSSGNVGIGTSSPSGRLHAEYSNDAWSLKVGAPSGRLRISGYIAGYAGAAIESVDQAENTYKPLWINGSTTVFGASGTPKLYIRSDGDIGIGTSGSLYPGVGRQSVNINGASESLIALTIGNAAAFYTFAHAGGTQILETRNLPMTFGTNSLTRMYIGNNGNVGIGTQGPGFKLDVIGNAGIGSDQGGDSLRALTLTNYSNANTTGKWVALSFQGVDTGSARRESGLIISTPANADWTAAHLMFYARNSGGIFEAMIINQNGSIFISNVSSVPGTPSGGGVFYVESGAFKYRGSSGTVTVLAPA